ncbi:hypothetical protein ABBQ32_000816 [Trebouxia sp. C0010 RCD-2024]
MPEHCAVNFVKIPNICFFGGRKHIPCTCVTIRSSKACNVYCKQYRFKPDNTVLFWRRALGHAAFRSKMLARYGTVVTVPYKPANTNVKRLAHVVKEAVEGKTGLPLDSFCR